jgi:hypothetical protein
MYSLSSIMTYPDVAKGKKKFNAKREEGDSKSGMVTTSIADLV